MPFVIACYSVVVLLNNKSKPHLVMLSSIETTMVGFEFEKVSKTSDNVKRKAIKLTLMASINRNRYSLLLLAAVV